MPTNPNNKKIWSYCIFIATAESNISIVCSASLAIQKREREREKQNWGQSICKTPTHIETKSMIIYCNSSHWRSSCRRRWGRRRRRARRRAVRMQTAPLHRASTKHQHRKADSHHAQRRQKILTSHVWFELTQEKHKHKHKRNNNKFIHFTYFVLRHRVATSIVRAVLESLGVRIHAAHPVGAYRTSLRRQVLIDHQTEVSSSYIAGI